MFEMAWKNLEFCTMEKHVIFYKNMEKAQIKTKTVVKLRNNHKFLLFLTEFSDNLKKEKKTRSSRV